MAVAAITEVPMPRLSDLMEEGTIIKWLKTPGDDVAVGEPLVEIETDKATTVYESDSAGRLIDIVAPEGATILIGQPIARIGPLYAHDNDNDNHPSPLHGGRAKPAAAQQIKASPVARRLATENGLDLSAIPGTGPNGRIVKADVESAAGLALVNDPESSPRSDAPARTPRSFLPNGPVPAPAPPPPPAGATWGEAGRPQTAKGTTEVAELTKLQQTVAQRMSESKATAPHFYLQTEIDMSRAVATRTLIKASAGEDEAVPSFNDMVVKACAIALRAFPRANGAYREGRLELYSRVNIGIAVAAENALVVPTVFDADQKGLRQIAAETRALAARVRDGTVIPPELSGGTFTVSNLGSYGITNFTAVINPPQAAILAVGAIVEKPVVRDGEITAAHVMPVTLASDHRILYGADASEFLARIRELLEEPFELAL